MTLSKGDKFTWTAVHGEVYTFVAERVEEFGNIYSIDLEGGGHIEAFGQEINCPEDVEILDEQINPQDYGEPIRYGAMR